MELLLKDLNKLEESVQQLSVIDDKTYSYFQKKIEELRNKLTKLEDTRTDTLQQEIDRIITSINKLKNEFSNYMKTGNIKKVPGKLFFELPEQDDSDISGNEKIKRHRLGLLASTVELAKKDVQLDFNKVEQTIAKFNSEKSNTDQEYSTAEIDYIDRLIAELFIEYQRKYYQENGTLPTENPSDYCNMGTYESVMRVLASEKLIEEKNRISKIEGLILNGQVVNSKEIWDMISGEEKSNKGLIRSFNPDNKQSKTQSNQLIPVRTKKRINNNLILITRKKNIFGKLVEKRKRIKLDINGRIEIPEKMKNNVVRAILPNGIRAVNSNAFCDCINLSEVFIPESVRKIGQDAFRGCVSLENIELPDNLTDLGIGCFCDSGLHSIKIPKSVIRIETSAFSDCKNLRQVLLQEGLKRIDAYAFYNTMIVKIRIPDSVVSVDESSLRCPYLCEINLPKTLKDIKLNLYNTQKTKLVIRVNDIITNTNKRSTDQGRIFGRERD